MRMIAKVGEWFDQRLQLAAPIREAVEHPIPRNTASWGYVFGSAALAVFLLQVVTGILLALIYVPSAGEAWNSLQALNHQVALGWFIRAMHGWGSNFMVAIVLIHMVQVFLFGAHKFPRELTWVIGVFLLLMTLGMAFTGQVMRFDRHDRLAFQRRQLDQVHEHRAALNVCEELVAEAGPGRRAFDQPGDVGEHRLAVLPFDRPQCRRNRREGIVGDLRRRAGEPAEQRALAGVREPDQADVGKQFQPQLDPVGFAFRPFLGEARRLPGRGGEAPIAVPAATAHRDDRPLARLDQIDRRDGRIVAAIRAEDEPARRLELLREIQRCVGEIGDPEVAAAIALPVITKNPWISFRHLDLAIARNIRLGGGRNIQLRVDMFNATNRAGITGRQTTMNLNSTADPVTITNLPFLSEQSKRNILDSARAGRGGDQEERANPPGADELRRHHAIGVPRPA